MSNVGEVYYNETDYGDDVTGSKTDVLLGINLEIRSQLFSWTGKGPCKWAKGEPLAMYTNASVLIVAACLHLCILMEILYSH